MEGVGTPAASKPAMCGRRKAGVSMTGATAGVSAAVNFTPGYKNMQPQT